jgi:hypothetical protein
MSKQQKTSLAWSPFTALDFAKEVFCMEGTEELVRDKRQIEAAIWLYICTLLLCSRLFVE